MVSLPIRSRSKKVARKSLQRAPGPAITVRGRPGKPAQGLLNLGGAVFPCALGRAGISAFKREGDGATPLARMPVLAGLVRRSRRFQARTALPIQRIDPALGWCDAIVDRSYNRAVRLPYPASHETMWRADGLYDVCIVLGWNIAPRLRGRGSAIFLHLARPGYAPTEGCIAVSRQTMARLLPLLRQGSAVRVVR